MSAAAASETIALQEAAEFVWAESDILDRADYEAWLALWTDGGLYVIPTDPDAEDHADRLNIVYDDAAMRRARVRRLTGGLAISASPAARTVRLNARFVVRAQTDGRLAIRSALHLTEEKFGRQRTFVASVDHTLVRSGAGLQIDEKVVRLINADGVLTSISYLF